MSLPGAREWLIRLRGPRADVGRLMLLTAVLFAAMAGLNPDRFLTVRNLTSMAVQLPELGLLALALLLPMITAGIDLSIVSVANLAGIAAALVLTRCTPPGAAGPQLAAWIAAAAGAGVLTGAFCGAFNGLLIGRWGLTPILATLGTMQLFLGAALVITRGPAVAGFPAAALWLGNGAVLGVPVPLLLFVLVAVAVAVGLTRTRFGLQLFLLGTNETAARYAGFRVGSLLIRTYLVSGVIAAVAGLLMISRTNSAKADYGTSYLLQAVLVAILGGVHPSGGAGTVGGLVLAVLSLQFLSSGFGLLRLSQFAQEFAWGALLLFAMALNARLARAGR